MFKKILTVLAALLSLGQLFFVASFLLANTTDNFPLFVYLFIVPAANLAAIWALKNIDK